MRKHSFSSFIGLFLISVLLYSCASTESYSVRGVVIRLAPEDNGKGRIVILHEAIKDFKNQEGEVVGMDPMAMSFGLKEKGMLSSVEMGDKVSINFSMRWKKEPRMMITAMQRLDQKVELNLGGYVIEGAKPK